MIENFPYTEQDWKMIKKYGISGRFDWEYMLWRKKLHENLNKK